MNIGLILSGGQGLRLWPASRKNSPKQTLSFSDTQESLLEATARRLSILCGQDNLAVVTVKEQRHWIDQLLPNIASDRIITEPSPKNTAPAIGLAAVFLDAHSPNATLCIVPADHHIQDEKQFVQTLQQGCAIASEHTTTVTVGIKPTHPHTGYGYLECGDHNHHEALTIKRFIEKPPLETAQQYVDSQDYLWNSGIFIVSTKHILSEINIHLPELGNALNKINTTLKTHGKPAAYQQAIELYHDITPISIDQGVMEHTNNIVALQGTFGWNDVGSWESVAEFYNTDDNNNVAKGDIITKDATNNIIIGQDGKPLVVIGLHDSVVVQSENGTLVISKDKLQTLHDLPNLFAEKNFDDYL